MITIMSFSTHPSSRMSFPMARQPPDDAELRRRIVALKREKLARGSGGDCNVGDANSAHGVRDPLGSSGRPGGGGGRQFSLGASRKGRRPCVALHDTTKRRKEKKGLHAWLGFLTSCFICSPLPLPDDATINRREVICVEPYFSIPVTPPAMAVPS